MSIQKNTIFLSITFLLIFFGTHLVSAQTDNPKRIKQGDIDPIAIILDGNEILFDVPPTQVNGHLLVPARNILEALGYSVHWDEEKQRVTAENGLSSMEIEIGDFFVLFNGCESYSYLHDEPQIIEGRTFIPLYFFADGTNYDVLWDEDKKTVYIEPKFSGAPSIRPNQNTGFLEDKMFLREYENLPDINILEDPTFSDFSFNQTYDNYFYYFSKDTFLYRSNLSTGEMEQVTSFPIKSFIAVGDYIYYQKSGETNYLFRAALDGKEETLIIHEPCGDYRVMDGKVYYIQMDDKSLREYSIENQQQNIIYNGFTNCFDISIDTHKVYYATAEYTNASAPLTYTGVYCYDTIINTNELIDTGETIHADQLWCLDNTLFYQTPPIDECYSLYRYHLDYGYNINLLNNLVDTLQVHKNRLLYYTKNPAAPPTRYLSKSDGASPKSTELRIWQGINYLKVLKELPDAEYFDEYLARDLAEYFISQGHVEYMLFRRTMIIGSTNFPKYYAWVTVTDSDGNVVTEGAVCLNAYEKKGFAITDFLTKEKILENRGSVGDVFPLFLQKKIFELAEA